MNIMTYSAPFSMNFRLWCEVEGWRRTALLIGLGWALLLGFFYTDTAMLADTYWNSSIFEHCIVIVPVIAWLVWQRWDVVGKIAPQGWAGGLLWMAGGLAAWLVGYATDINVGRHLGLIVILQGMALALIGPNAARALLFPFAYSFFLLPIGDQLVEPMQLLTADLAMALLALTGIAATLNGIFITTDAGFFRVAEACAGVNFLIAMVVLAVLVANIAFKSWKRRAFFVLAAIVTPILGNGVRAWGTMMIADLYGVEYADGFDHIFYGWFFFAIITALLIGGAWRFFDRAPGEHGLDVRDYRTSVRFPLRQGHALSLALLIALPGAWLTGSANASAPLPQRTLLPEFEAWQAVETPRDYLPSYPGADHKVLQRYRDDAGHEVDLFMAIYGSQGDGREIIAVNQGAVDTINGWVWTNDAEPLATDDGLAPVVRLTAPDKSKRQAVVFYRLDGETTAEEARVKWLMLKQRLLGGDPRAMAVVISAEGDGARDAIAAFLAMVGPVGPIADRVAGVTGGD